MSSGKRLPGSLITATHYVQARRYAAALHRRCLEVLRTVDALVSPTMGFTALPYGERRLVIDGEAVDAAAALGTYMALASLTGLPALTLPCGFDQSGLPIGLQIVGPPRVLALPDRCCLSARDGLPSCIAVTGMGSSPERMTKDMAHNGRRVTTQAPISTKGE